MASSGRVAGRDPYAKYDRLIADAKQVRPVITIVVHPCDETSLRGACELRRKRASSSRSWSTRRPKSATQRADTMLISALSKLSTQRTAMVAGWPRGQADP